MRKYIPALKDLPDEFVYEPWKAPLDVQKESKCVVGVDYPERIVDHDVVSKKNISKIMKVVEEKFLMV